MTSVSELLKTTFDSARTRLVMVEKSVEKLEKKAKTSLDGLQAQFDTKKIEGAWAGFVDRVKPALVFATRSELHQLAAKVDDLADKIDKLTQGKARKTPSA